MCIYIYIYKYMYPYSNHAWVTHKSIAPDRQDSAKET